MGRKLRKDRSETLGFLLQRERKCQHITQEEMAKILGVTQERVSEIESGKRRLSVMELMEYCEALNLTPTALAGKIETYFFSMGLLPRSVLKKLILPDREVQLKANLQICDNSFMATISDKTVGEMAFTAKTFEELKKTIEDKLRCLGIDSGLEYNFLDAHSLLKASSPYVSLAAISRVSSINQSLLSQYANGKKHAQPYKIKLIKDALHKIGWELMAMV